MLIEQTFVINAPAQQVWDFLLDIPRMSACMPGVEKVEAVDDKTYQGSLKVKVGPIAAQFGGKVTLLEVDPPHRMLAQAEGSDKRTSSLVSAKFGSTLKPLSADTTEVAYEVDVAVRGLLGRYGQGVMREVAKSMTTRFARCVEEALKDTDHV